MNHRSSFALRYSGGSSYALMSEAGMKVFLVRLFDQDLAECNVPKLISYPPWVYST